MASRQGQLYWVAAGCTKGQLDWVSSASTLCQENASSTVADFISLAFSMESEALSKRDVSITKVSVATLNFMVKRILSDSWLFTLSRTLSNLTASQIA